jgi:hypothetical protein
MKGKSDAARIKIIPRLFDGVAIGNAVEGDV